MGVVYSMYDALVSINVPTEKAKAVIDAMEREMMDKVATKTDLEHVRDVLSKDIRTLALATKTDLDHVRDVLSQDIGATKTDLARVQEMLSKDIQHVSNTITLRMILTAAALVPAIVAVQKLF